MLVFPKIQKMRFNNKGFSGPEFVIVVGIIIGLIGASIPTFFYLQKKSHLRYFKNYTETLQTELEAWHAKELLKNQDSWPVSLDNQAYPAPCLSCFSGITKAVESNLWEKTAINEYVYNQTLKLSYDANSGILKTTL